MREIRFRGKRVANGKWVDEPFYLYDATRGRHILTDGLLDIVEVLKETLGMFTGCKDRNEKDIYEGDIVECVSWNEYFSKDGQPMEPFRRKMYVDFRKGAFVMVEPMPSPLKDNVWPIIYYGDIEVIGNIWDNPELIPYKDKQQ